MKKRIRKWLNILLIAYLLIGIALYFLQTAFLFHPEKLAADHKFNFNVPFEEVNIDFENGDRVNMVKFFPKDSVRRGAVLYYHGNKQNIERYAKFADNFTKHGYEVWMEDYPGFGKSTGDRTEKKLYEQALQIEQMAEVKFGKDSIIIFGKSLGTGIAAYVAAETHCRRLILETPYYSIPDLFSSYAPIYPAALMATYKIPTNKFLQKVKCPVAIFHGTDDGVIPFSCAVKLKTVLKPADEFIRIDGGTHHNLNDFSIFHQKIDSLLEH